MMSANLYSNPSAARDGYVPVNHARLYYREIGQGQPIIILHGGPDFDHRSLLPEMDRLSHSFHLIYYDQRGRGKSAESVQPDGISIQSEIEDLESLRKYFGIESIAILGHSWGGLLALEYALRHPERVSHLILMNSAPVSRRDAILLREHRLKTAAADLEKLMARSSDIKYQEGDPDTVAAYYRIHFRAALRRPEHLETVIQILRASFTREGILKAREIERRLMSETWTRSDYDLIPKLEQLSIPTLIIHGDHDFIPIECVAPIEQAIPGARIVLLKECGHFSYLENPDGFRNAILDFFQSI